jgi:hypothetical protein
MNHGPHPKKSKGNWYVSFEPKVLQPGQRAFIRKTETFRNEEDAKAFAKSKLTMVQDICTFSVDDWVAGFRR